MNGIGLTALTFACGIAIAIQSSLSGQLGKILDNPLFATLSLYFMSGFMLSAIFLLALAKKPTWASLTGVPLYFWFAGSICSIAGLGTAYWLMPRIGLARVMTGIVVGQLTTSVIVSHFGLFGLPEHPLNLTRGIGLLLLVTGVGLINVEKLS